MGFDYSHFFNEEEEPKDEFLEQQYKEFVEVVRTYLLILLLVSILCFIASYIISYFQNVDLNSEVCFFFVHPIPIAYSVMSWIGSFDQARPTYLLGCHQAVHVWSGHCHWYRPSPSNDHRD